MNVEFHTKNKKKRLLIVATIPRFFVHLIENIKEFEKSGFEVTLLSTYESYGNFLRDKHQFSLNYLNIPREISPKQDLKSLIEIYQYLRKNDFDIVHSLTPKAGLLISIAAFLARTPIRIHTFTGQRWATLKNPLRFVLKLLDRLVMILDTQCYADSNSQIEYLINEGIADKKNLICIHKGSLGGIDTGKFNRNRKNEFRHELIQKYNLSPDIPWILFLGRVTKDKGINELISAFEESLKEVKSHLIIVGPYEAKLDPIDEKSVHAINNNSYIRHLGFQNNPETIIPACDFLCLPSYREGFGTVVIEAAASGLCTLGTDIPGLQDAIIDGETGILTPSHNVSTLKEKIILLCKDNELRKALSQNAYNRAREHFDFKTIAKYQIKEYQRLLKLKNIN